MLKLNAILLGGAAVLCASAAQAAPGPQWHTTSVDLPDGSQAEIHYVGDIPPRVVISQPVVQETDAAAAQPVGEEIAYGGIPRARRVIQQPVTTLPAPQQPAPPRFIVSGQAPKGSTYEYSLITTGADGRVCTERTEWTSRGKGKEPQVKQTNIGDGCATLATRPAPDTTPQIQPVDPDAI